MVVDAIGSFGGIAQLGEHLICIQGVVGSNPSTSTKRSLRLSVRTRGFHPRKRGSIPLGTAKRSISVAVNTSPCHGEDHGFDSRMLRHTSR